MYKVFLLNNKGISMNKKPNILITNDDGIYAPGIMRLWEALTDIANLIDVAPSSEQSATSLSITIRQPLRIEEIEWANGSSAWSVTGTPADCVKLGLSVLLKKEPDLVVSGINRGTNSGRNILYSGTVAGAIEGVMHDIPSIAFSCYDMHGTDYKSAQKFIPSIVQHVLEHSLPQGTLLNVNFPSKSTKEIKGFRLTRHGKEFWGEDPDERLHPAEGHSYYWLGAKLAKFDEHDDCDVSWLKKGYMTAVPVHIGDFTDHGHLSEGREHFDNLFDAVH